MKEKHMNKKSLTDWKRIDALKDEDIDTSDIPPLDPELLRAVGLHNTRVRIGGILLE